MATKAELENALRDGFMESIRKMVDEVYDTDVFVVGSNEFSIPVVDAEGNESYVNVKVSVPRGTRNGQGGYIPYNGEEAAKEYAQEKADKAQERAVKKAMKEAEKKKNKKGE